LQHGRGVRRDPRRDQEDPEREVTPSALQLFGTIFLVALVLILALPRLVEQWAEASNEDERWRSARRELAGSVEIIGLDTRLLRPWGDSAAAERFVVPARAAGHGWVEPAIKPLHVEQPIAIRALAGELEGTKVAFVVARTRDAGTIVKRLALGPSGLVEEL